MSRTHSGSTVLLIALLLAGTSAAQVAPDLDYTEIRPAQPTSDSNRIVVTEFFSYQCPHCAAFEPYLQHWLSELPDDVAFERVAVSFGREAWTPAARAFYTLKAMGESQALHAAIFRAIHAEGERFGDKGAIVSWMQGQGIDARAFSGTYDSFGIDAALRQAEQQTAAYKVTSIPGLAIDGRYRVRLLDNGTFERQLKSVNDLIESARLARQR